MGCFEFRKSVVVFQGGDTGHSCCIFLSCQRNAVFLNVHIFNSIFLDPFLFTSIWFTLIFIIIMSKECIVSVWGFLSEGSIFLGCSEIPNSLGLSL